MNTPPSDDENKDERHPQVSIIIPTYNRANLIGHAIQSVLLQDFTDFELIVVDDGSTDDTAAIVGGFSDERLIFIVQENGGRSAARNRALAQAKGQFIAFLDSDDMYVPTKLGRQVAFLRAHATFEMVYTSAECVDFDGKPLPGQRYVASAEGDIYRLVAFFRPLTITLPTVMLRREVLDRVGFFDEGLDRFEDTDLWRRVSKNHRIGAMPEVTCILRTHSDNSLESQNPEVISDAIARYVFKVFEQDADVEGKFLRYGASRLNEYYGRAFISGAGMRRYGLRLLGAAIAYAPARLPKIVLGGVRSYVASLLRAVVAR